MNTKTSRKKASLITGEYRPLPDFSKISKNHINYKAELIYALNYTCYLFDVKQCKEFAEDYCTKVLNINISKVPDWKLKHLGNTCWILSNGGYLHNVKQIASRLKSLADEYNTPTKKIDVAVANKVPNPAIANTNNLIGELEGLIDDVILGKENIVNPIELYKSSGKFKPDDIVNHFQRQLDDIMIPDEDDIVMSEIDKKKSTLALTCILSQLKEFTTGAKKIRKTRKPKKINPIKLTSKMKFLKSCDEYNLQSINPAAIIGADTLWVFNVTNRKMTQFVSNDEGGLSVKRMYITNFDPAKTLEKRIRKPESFLKMLKESGKVYQRTLLKDIKAVSKLPTGIINKNCILVKVY